MGYILLFILNVLFPLEILAVLLYFIISPRRGLLKKLKDELRERFVLYSARELPKGCIWMHCASVGEVNSMTDMIVRLEEYYKKPVFVSTNTWAGKVTALKKQGVHAAMLLPFDFYPLSLFFVNRLKPYRMFVVEGELWPSTIMAAARHTKLIILNGRMSPKSAGKYIYIKSLYSLLMSKIWFATLQNEDIRKRYVTLGLNPDKAYAGGNVKYDSLNQHPTKTEEVKKLIEKLAWQDKKILVCGSTHPKEENMIIKAVPALAQNGVRVVMAPRHLERKAAIAENLRNHNIKFTLLSTPDQIPPDCHLLFADAMGWLTSFYAEADMSFVGGTVAKKGGHNLLEAAILSAPVLFGPYVYNTSDTAAALLKNGGGAAVTEDSFEETAVKLSKDSQRLTVMAEKARETALSFQGATEKNMEIINKYEQRK